MALDLPRDDLIEALSTGQISLAGRFARASNHTFLAQVSAGPTQLKAVYKPAAGERPLWDFPPRTLAQREVAAYLTSQALGWELVPPTVLREDGPAGGGSLQLFLEIDPERHYFNFGPQQRQLLAPAALFDVLVNNADRKAGHVLLGPDGRIWLIDHGVCFHREYKLRTVIWDFADQPIAPELLEDLKPFARALAAARSVREADGPPPATKPHQHGAPGRGPTGAAAGLPEAVWQLTELLTPAEFEALERRTVRLLETGCYPAPGPERPYPWPLI